MLKTAFAILLATSIPALAEEVVVGAQFPLSGPLASFSGPRLKHGADLAAERINASRMLGDGRTLKLIMEDNGSDKAQAIALASRFMNADKVTAMFGVYGSTLAVPVAPLANENKTLFLAIAASDAIVQAGPWSFMLLVPAVKEVELSGRLALKQLGAKTMAIVYDRTNDSSTRMKNALEAYVTANGAKVVAVEGVSPQDTNFGPLATKLASMKFDALYVESVPPVQANIFIQVRQAGLPDSVKLLGSPQATSPMFVQIGGKAVEGVYYPASYSSDLATPENQEFASKYRARANMEPDLPAAMAYAGMMLLGSAIKDAGPNADRDKVRDAFGKLRNIPSVMGKGKFSLDDNRFADYEDVMVRIENGKPVPVKLN